MAEPSGRPVFKPLLRYVRPHFRLLLLSLLLASVSVAAMLYAPILVGDAVDLIVTKDNVDLPGVGNVLIKLGVVVAVSALAQWLMSLCTNRVTYYVVRDIRNDAFSNLQRLPLSYIDRTKQGDMISRLVSDIENISDGLLMGFAQLFTGIVTIVGTLGFMISINFKITLVVVFITPLSMFAARFISRNTFKLFRRQTEARGELTALVEEMVGGAETLKAFSYEQESEKRFEEQNQKLRSVWVRAVFFSSLTNPCTRFINGLVYSFVGIIGAFTAIGGAFTVGQLSCFLTYANQYTKPFNEISGVITELQSALAAAGRVFEVIDEPREQPDVPAAVVLDKVSGALTAENVSFSYVPSVPLIEDFNLNVAPGQHIAIVGPTGCGKTTFINLLMRFYDVTGGRITVSGLPVRDCTRSSLRSSFGMVLQDTWLKTGTIRENISYAKPDATLDEVIKAAKAAHCHSFIKRLPQGYDTPISDEGGSLSQGQKQLLCIARVMLSLPPMLILDEATSSIDTRTEILIQRAFAEMMQGRTSFIIAHRLSTVRDADCILVMRSGHIVEQGTHARLMEMKGFYFELYNSQFEV
ncbi:MAG: ABC transporter ATP-binding protein [Ruminococcus sp.]|nr:ABC transporter ATP-binding protein [Ruminococcus sp.]